MKTLIPVAAALLLCVPAGATDLESLKPQVSFSAWRVMSAAGQTIEGRYYFTPGRHRNEMNLGGEQMTVILREDLGVIWNLMPGHGMYMEMSDAEFAEQGRTVGPDTTQLVEHELLGREIMGGYRTTKHRVTTRDPTGGTASGYFWATEEMIPVRMDLTTEDGERVVMEMSDIRVGEQPAALFEVPAGYQKFSLGGVSGLGQLWGRDADGAEDPGFAGEILDVAGEAAKEGTKQGVRQEVGTNVRKGLRKLFGN